MYYFAPKNPQNNKSSIVGQRLDVTIFEDFLNTAPVKKWLIFIRQNIYLTNYCLLTLLYYLIHLGKT